MSTAPTLSRVHLRIARGGGEAERRSTAPYLIHQAVADLFGDRDDRGYLYRVTAERPGAAEVLVLSAVPPQALHTLPSPPHRRAERMDSKPFTPQLSSGQVLDFEIRLNATQVVTRADGRKQRTDAWEAVWRADKADPSCSPHNVYGEYLQRKLMGAAELLPAQLGAEDGDDLPLARITERGEVRAGRGDRRDAACFVATNLIGTLRITNPERFIDVISSGIGRAKAFGCGLLLISRPGTVLARRYTQRAAELW